MNNRKRCKFFTMSSFNEDICGYVTSTLQSPSKLEQNSTSFGGPEVFVPSDSVPSFDTGYLAIEAESDSNNSEFGSLIRLGTDPSLERLAFHTFLMLVQLLLILIFIALLIWVPLKTWWRYKHFRSAIDPTSNLSHLPLPPGDFGLPFIGETLRWLAEGSDFNAIRRKKHGGVFKTNIVVGGPMVRVSGHEHVRQVLLGEHTKVTTVWPTNFRQVLGTNGMINSIGAIHQLKRKITCKAFSSSALNKYIPILRKCIDSNVDSLSTSERPLVYDKMLRLTFDMAASALIGLDPATSRGSKLIEAFHVMITNLFSIPLNLPGFAFRKAIKARNVILDLLQEHVTIKKEKILKSLLEGDDDEISNNREKSAFDIIIRELILENMSSSTQNGGLNNNGHGSPESGDRNNLKAIDDLTLKEIAIELIFAGYYTTGSSLTSCLLELSRHPEVVRNLENELLRHGLLKEEKDSARCDETEIDLRKVQRLTYMEQVLKETLRLRPPVLGAYRRAKKTFELGGYRIPKDWAVVYNIRDTHEMEFEGLDEFDPERFAPENSSFEKFRFIPFGGGPRMCIGQEYARLIIKLTLVDIIRKYHHWDLVNEGLPKMGAIPTLHPKDGLPCIFHPRQEVGVVSR